jgi:hypothetical protein
MMLVVPPYTCTRTLHERAAHALWQYDRGGADRKNIKTLTLELNKATVTADSANERESAQGNENKGAL